MEPKQEPKRYKVPQLNLDRFPPIPGSIEWHKRKVRPAPKNRTKK